jgi:glycosyltransferase involved in cell wall biosynthesis
MSFSIIIPVFNEENNIKSCLQSIKRFNNKVEVIVVDGGSIDDTLAISKPLADKIIASTKG